MLYDLSFTEAFFSGDGEVDMYDIQPSDRPTSILQAVISLPKKTQVAIARDVLGAQSPYLYIQSEGFAFEVVEKARETNLCDGGTSPVTVYLDPDQYYSVMVYDSHQEDED